MVVKKAQKCTCYPNLEIDAKKTYCFMLIFVSIEWRIKYNYHETWRLDSQRGPNHVFFSANFSNVKSLPAKHVNSVFFVNVSLFGCFQHVRPLVLWRIEESSRTWSFHTSKNHAIVETSIDFLISYKSSKMRGSSLKSKALNSRDIEILYVQLDIAIML